MMRVRLWAALAASTALTACANLAPTPRLDAAVPAAYAETGADQTPGAGPTPDDIAAWWTLFQDPELTDLVARAAKGNLDLQQTAARITEARQAEVIAGASSKPQVQLDTSASRNRISEHAIPLPPGSAGKGTGGASPFGIPGETFNSFRAGLDASWELDLFGGARNAIAAARARTQAAEWTARDLQVALAAEVADHYLTLRSLQRREAVAWEELTRQRALLAIVRARAERGFVSQLDVDQQQSLVDATEARAYPLEAQVRAEIHALGVLAGETPEALIPTLTPAAAQPVVPAAPPPGLPSDLLRRRPDIRKAERNVAAAAADVGAATAELYPKITLSGQPGFVSTSLSTLIDWGSRNYTVSAGLLWPILEGGRLRASLAGANARQTEALLTYRQAVLTGLKEVEDALSRYQADEALRGSLQASLDQARAAEAIANDQYRAGVVAFNAVLSAQQAVTGDEDQLAQADAACGMDVVALYRALGGGWTEAGHQETTP